MRGSTFNGTMAVLVTVVCAFILVAVLAGCGAEATKDATTNGQHVDRSPADVLAMPDKFGNIATKCDGHGHRVYITTHTDDAAQLFVISDPRCGS